MNALKKTLAAVAAPAAALAVVAGANAEDAREQRVARGETLSETLKRVCDGREYIERAGCGYNVYVDDDYVGSARTWPSAAIMAIDECHNRS